VIDPVVISTAPLLRGIGNALYENAFPIYRLCYRAFKAFTDRPERRLLKERLSAGDVVVDAGANIGIYSQFLSRCVGPTGMVHSFEPSPENFERLRSAARRFSNICLCQAAVGERSERSKLYISNELNVDHRVYLSQGDHRTTVPIDIIALDNYFKPGQRVDLIKMDIQGYELHALRGATRVLADNPAAKLLLEFWPYGLKQAGVNYLELVEALKDKRRSLSQVTHHGLVAFRSESVTEDPNWYVNLFAAP
jgi:FkbM family methyltransferase